MGILCNNYRKKVGLAKSEKVRHVDLSLHFVEFLWCSSVRAFRNWSTITLKKMINDTEEAKTVMNKLEHPCNF